MHGFFSSHHPNKTCFCFLIALRIAVMGNCKEFFCSSLGFKIKQKKFPPESKSTIKLKKQTKMPLFD